MTTRLRRCRGATTAMEFALVAPVMLLIFVASLALTLALWTESVLQETCSEAARCAALGASPCASITIGCDSANAAICYVEQVARARGNLSLTASNIAVTTGVSVGGMAFTAVKITYPYHLEGFSLSLSASDSFATKTAIWGQPLPPS